jgi:phosphatidylserine/phosphatidylglycerophosphate/cardiolipin synthase-like enzyme
MLTFLIPLAMTVSNDAIVYFAPEDHLEKRLIDMIAQENQSIAVCIFTFTHRGIANALVEAKKRGVAVEVVVDRFSVKKQSPLQRIVSAGIPVYVWNEGRGKKAKRPLMHNKFCVFGSGQVWTGSFNFTYDAAKIHQENVIVLKDQTLATAYHHQFENLKIRSCTPYTSYVAQNRRRL